MQTDIKKIILGLVASAVIVGGIIIGLKTGNEESANLMTYDEYLVLIEIYSNESKQLGGNVLLENRIDQSNLAEKLNAALSKRTNKDFQKIGGIDLTSDEYNILRSGLMKKAKIKIPEK